ncbi:uncharacterized protein LOC117781084 [Drosophila innubila]|uniref:uncharacterized protein LOC117781084 n=1 Tax=Drosophila innubila TaxID=198719 RepID=UPI00148D4F0A|nr:uncharacterized protein LOC117781084 [Drosophila innubila]
METNTTSLLPYVLDLLSRKPDLSSTTEELCEHMKDVVIEDVISPFGSLQRAVEFAIELGMNIGLLSLTEEKVLMPFKLKPSASNIKNTALPPTQCRSLIKRLAKTLCLQKIINNLYQTETHIGFSFAFGYVRKSV